MNKLKFMRIFTYISQSMRRGPLLDLTVSWMGQNISKLQPFMDLYYYIKLYVIMQIHFP
jgi:hypothetical protein